jgi:hypothetical protein
MEAAGFTDRAVQARLLEAQAVEKGAPLFRRKSSRSTSRSLRMGTGTGRGQLPHCGKMGAVAEFLIVQDSHDKERFQGQEGRGLKIIDVRGGEAWFRAQRSRIRLAEPRGDFLSGGPAGGPGRRRSRAPRPDGSGAGRQGPELRSGLGDCFSDPDPLVRTGEPSKQVRRVGSPRLSKGSAG